MPPSTSPVTGLPARLSSSNVFWLFEVLCGGNQLVCQLGALFGVRDEGVRGSGFGILLFFGAIDYRKSYSLVPNSESRLPHKLVFLPTNTSWTTLWAKRAKLTCLLPQHGHGLQHLIEQQNKKIGWRGEGF